jgi:hypothetical protein
VQRCEVELAVTPVEAERAIAATAEPWGAEWLPRDGGGRLALPVVFGLRRGVLVGEVAIAPVGGGSKVTWRQVESHLEVHRSSVAVLSIAAVPLLGVLGWPLWPPLLAFAPLAAVLGLLAWWLVVSRLRSSGPEDFLAALKGDMKGDRQGNSR